MICGKAIFAKLAGDAGVSTIVGTRIYPRLSLQVNTYPLIVYFGDDTETDQLFSGSSSFTKDMIKIACIAKTSDGAGVLASAVMAALNGQSGTWGGIVVQGAFFQNGSETEDIIPGLEQDGVLFTNELDFTICFNRP